MSTKNSSDELENAARFAFWPLVALSAVMAIFALDQHSTLPDDGWGALYASWYSMSVFMSVMCAILATLIGVAIGIVPFPKWKKSASFIVASIVYTTGLFVCGFLSADWLVWLVWVLFVGPGFARAGYVVAWYSLSKVFR